MASAGKFITHIAALQCVELGLITLDEPLYSYLPELEKLNVISITRDGHLEDSTRLFLLQSPVNKITLRHLLSHSSGIDYESNPLIQEWRASTGQEPKADYHPIIDYESTNYDYQPDAEAFSTPLLFEPGEGWMYGASIEWTSLLISRLTKQPLGQYIQEHIFESLGMTSSTYHPQNHPNIYSRILEMVMRDGDDLVPIKFPVRELVSSVPDIAALLADLISGSSRLLKQDSIELLFAPQFAPSSAALSLLRRDTETYAAPAGIPSSMMEAPVNHSLAALVVEEELSLSHMPAGTVTWNGMPNLMWAMHREKGLGMVFATQLLPVDDEKTVNLAMAFMREAWDRFG